MEYLEINPRNSFKWVLSDSKITTYISYRKGFKKIEKKSDEYDLTKLLKYDWSAVNDSLCLTFDFPDELLKKDTTSLCVYLEPKKTAEVLSYIKRFLPQGFKAQTVFKRHCKVCGHIYSYSKEDIENNIRYAQKEQQARTGMLVNAVALNIINSSLKESLAETYSDKQVDFSRCPKCNSNDTVEITDKELEKIQAAEKNETSAVSAADELKKFKELLDMGVISQEEFDAKKKQLLGL